jgi:response regulator RpfG family c-di-GMP phosphodiesterase
MCGNSGRRGELLSNTTDKTTVLIVDDDQAIRDILHQALKGRFDVVPAENGSQALSRLENCSFELALLDVQMPGIDGIRLLEEIGVPDAILMKPGRLAEKEREIIRTHPVTCFSLFLLPSGACRRHTGDAHYH